MRGLVKEFRSFIARGSVIDLAVAVVIGTAFGAITKSLVKDMIMPPIGLLLGGVDFSQLAIVLKDAAQYETLQAAIDAGMPVLRYGVFLYTVVNFFIIAFAMFMVVRTLTFLEEWRKKEEEDPASPVAPPKDIQLLGEMRDLLQRLVDRGDPQERRPSK